MKPEIQRVNADQYTQFASVLDLLKGAFAYMEDRIDPPSSLKLLDAEKLKQKAQQETLFVLTVNNELAGCVFAREEVDFLYLGKLAIKANYKGHGFARKLIEQVETLAQMLALKHVELETRVELTENQSLFEYLGYKKIAENAHPGYRQPTSYRYRKTLG